MKGELVALLLPGAVFCCLMAIDWKKHGSTPTIIVCGWRLPTPLVYGLILTSGWLFLALMLADRMKRRS